PVAQAQDDVDEEDPYLLAKACFDSREFHRAAHILGPCVGPRSVFLRLYATLLAGEQNHSMHLNQTGNQAIDPTVKKMLLAIESELADLAKKRPQAMDGFLFYLYGIVCKKLEKTIQSFELLLKSVRIYPYNWSAWLELASCLQTTEEADALFPKLPKDFMANCFYVYANNELGNESTVLLTTIDDLSRSCPNSPFLIFQRIAHYSNRRFSQNCEELFDKLIAQDPSMIEGMDMYSNILYLQGKTTKLMDLAHRLTLMHKYRPETCVALGNYYVMKQDSANAIKQFMRAIRLNPLCSAAWVLLGHEYLEKTDGQSAIFAYRRTINPRDYRAWFGLAQAYDLLNLQHFSLMYSQRALSLRPYDGRIWQYISFSFEKFGSTLEAIHAIKRALLCQEAPVPDGFARLARLYEKFLDEKQMALERQREDAVAEADADGDHDDMRDEFGSIGGFGNAGGRHGSHGQLGRDRREEAEAAAAKFQETEGAKLVDLIAYFHEKYIEKLGDGQEVRITAGAVFRTARNDGLTD
ncbi:hypothetical protein BC831DRAFT_402213, partial [Entophlyctis helioformis]